MSTSAYVLAIDLGTGGPKVGFVSTTGTAKWQTHVPVATEMGERGAATQDARQWWSLISQASRRGLLEAGIAPSQVIAVGVTSQWASIVPVDGAGEPVGDCIMWMDRRGGRDIRQRIGGIAAGYAPGAALSFLRRAGAPPSLGGDDTAGHLAYLCGSGRGLGDKAKWFLEPMDYLSMRFTGEAVATPASMCASWLFDTRDPGVTTIDPVLVNRLGLDADKLPRVTSVGSIVGQVTEGASAATGLLVGTPVVTGLPDLHSACLGSGAIRDFQAHLAISTTSWLSCPVTAKKTDIAHSIATVPGITKDRYLMVNNQDSGGRCLDWLRDQVLGTGGTPPSIATLLELAETIPAGAGGVQFTPWLAGERTPISDRYARGGLNNVGVATSGAHLVRATLEGVAMNSRWLLHSAEKFTKHRFDQIRLIGGGAQSRLWCQIMADVMDRSIEQVEDPRNANLRGMALFAAIAVGESDLATSASHVHVAETFHPDPKHRQLYDDAFGRFTETYRAQKKLFRKFNVTAS